MNWNPISWFPFTRDGRQTLVYLVLAGCGPALTAGIMWALTAIRDFKDATAEAKLDKFADLAMMLGYNSMTPTSYEEWYRPREQRLYRADQG